MYTVAWTAKGFETGADDLNCCLRYLYLLLAVWRIKKLFDRLCDVGQADCHFSLFSLVMIPFLYTSIESSNTCVYPFFS